MKYGRPTCNKSNKKEQVAPLVVTFHPDLPHLTRILYNNQCLIKISQRLRVALPKPPNTLVAYRHPPKYGSRPGKKTYEGKAIIC